MLHLNKYKIILLLSVLLYVVSCKKKEIYSDIPEIKFRDVSFISDNNGYDSLMVLGFTFRDGDGDLGLSEKDTLYPFNSVWDSLGNETNPFASNLHIDYFESINGVFQNVVMPFSTDTLRYAFRFESLTPDGRHKAIRGDIEVKITPSYFQNAKDTVKYTFFVYDRALHKSNIVETPVIIWSRKH